MDLLTDRKCVVCGGEVIKRVEINLVSSKLQVENRQVDAKEIKSESIFFCRNCKLVYENLPPRNVVAIKPYSDNRKKK
jgi:hypothetical protein